MTPAASIALDRAPAAAPVSLYPYPFPALYLTFYLATGAILPTTLIGYEYGIAWNLDRILKIVLIAAWFAWKARYRLVSPFKDRAAEFWKTFGPFLLAVAASAAFNARDAGSAAIVKSIVYFGVESVFFAYIVYDLLFSEEMSASLRRGLVYFGLGLILTGLLEAATGIRLSNLVEQWRFPIIEKEGFTDLFLSATIRENLLRIKGSFLVCQAYAGGIVLVYPLFMQLAEREARASRRTAYRIGLVVLAVLLVLTGTRGAYLAVLFQLAFFAPFLLKKKVKLAVMAAALAVMVIAIDASYPFIVNFLSSDNFIYSGSIKERLTDYPDSLAFIRSKPLFGYGGGSFSEMGRTAFITDNAYLLAALEFGLVGFLALLWMIGRPLLRSFRRARPAAVAARPDAWAVFAILGFAIYMTTNDALHWTFISPIFLAVLGVALKDAMVCGGAR